MGGLTHRISFQRSHNVISNHIKPAREQKRIWRRPFIGFKKQPKTETLMRNLILHYSIMMEKEPKRIWRRPFIGSERQQKTEILKHNGILRYYTEMVKGR